MINAVRRRLKILFLIRTLGRGGAERQLSVLAKEIHSRSHDVVVAVLYGGGDFQAALIDAGVTVVNLEKKGRWDVFGFFARYRRLLKEVRPDVLHGYMPMQNLLALIGGLWLRNVKVVWGIRDSSIGHGRIPWSVTTVFRLSCALARFCNLIISNSQAGKSLYSSNGCPEELIAVVPNGIDAQRFQRNDDARVSVRRSWGVSDGEILIGCVGRLDPGKDHATYLRACAKVMSSFPSARFACVGGGGSDGYVNSLRVLAGELGLTDRLIWTGECREMASVYSALDLAVSASLHEGFPNVVAEAMSCEVPVIGTDVGDVRQIVDGIGLCVSAGDADRLADAIGEILRQDLRALGKASRQRIVDLYSVEKLVERTERLLDGLFQVNASAGMRKLSR